MAWLLEVSTAQGSPMRPRASVPGPGGPRKAQIEKCSIMLSECNEHIQEINESNEKYISLIHEYQCKLHVTDFD